VTPVFRQKIAGNAWETVEESSGGGGGVEALASFSPTVVHNIADATSRVVDWTANAPAFGSGIALNGDGQTTDLDDGWYQIAVMLSLASDDPDTPKDFSFFIVGIDDPTWQVYAKSGQIANPALTVLVTTPPILFDASTQNSFTVEAFGNSGSAETWSILAAGAMRVWRLGIA
jgi:hypothetical protein